jgi:hypothetical protein
VFIIDEESSLNDALQGLPQEPVDKDISITILVQSPVTSGKLITAVGMIGFTGPLIKRTDEVEFFHVTQGLSAIKIHLALIASP